MADDYTHDLTTTGAVSVGGAASGEIEQGNDFDWFAVELVEGRTYVIDVEGSDTGNGTLDNPVLRGLYDSGGVRIAGTQRTGGGEGSNARLTYTAAESATFYIAARGYGNTTGSYAVRVTDTTPTPDPDSVRSGAVDWGDITELEGAQYRSYTLNGTDDTADYYRFTLRASARVGLALRQQETDADLFLEDDEGNALASSESAGTGGEWISTRLAAGTYYVRVEAQEEGDNGYRLRYGVSGVHPNAAPAFTATSYAFDLAENADGSTDRVALGTVSASDPEAASLIYSMESGNGAVLPVTFVAVAIRPCAGPATVGFIVTKLPHVAGAISPDVCPAASSLAVAPVAFIAVAVMPGHGPPGHASCRCEYHPRRTRCCMSAFPSVPVRSPPGFQPARRRAAIKPSLPSHRIFSSRPLHIAGLQLHPGKGTN